MRALAFSVVATLLACGSPDPITTGGNDQGGQPAGAGNQGAGNQGAASQGGQGGQGQGGSAQGGQAQGGAGGGTTTTGGGGGAGPVDCAVAQDGTVCETGTCCGGMCRSDYSSDGENCGSCGHSCLGGACGASTCQPVAVATALDHPIALAQDADNIYFSEYGDGNVKTGRLKRMSKATSVVDAIVPNGWGDAAITVQNNVLYHSVFHNDGVGAVYKCVLPGCANFTSNPVFECNPGVLQYCGINYSQMGSTSTGISFVTIQRIVQCNPNSSTCDAFAGGFGPYTIGDTVADAQRIYWTDFGTGKVYTRPNQSLPNNTVFSEMVSGQDNPKHLGQNATHLFWTVNGGIASAVKSNVPVTADALIASDANHLAVDGNALFWTTIGSGSLNTCDVTDCAGTAKQLATGYDGVGGPVVVDSEAVYFLHDMSSAAGVLVRVAR